MSGHFDRQAEQYALGSMMLDARRVWDVLDVAGPADFHDPSHESIAEAVRRLALRGEGTDPVLVWDELASMGVSIPQGVAYLHECTSVVSTAVNGEFYADIVAKQAVRRRLADAAARVNRIAADATLEPDEQIEQARAAVDASIVAKAGTVHTVGESLDDMLARMSEPPIYTETPWRSINDIIGGLRPRAMYVVGARPASGKSIMAMNLAVALAREGNVAVCSLEMGEEELQKRLVSQLGHVHMSAMVNNALDADDWQRVKKARAEIISLPLFIDDRPGQTVAQVRSHVRSVARKGKLSGLVVDYLQLMESADPRKERRLAIGEFSRAMKLIAKEFDIPVVVLAQLNRKSEERAGRRPMLSDLRESGDLEQDADVVLLLSRDADDPARAGEVDVQIAKNRHGSTGETALAWMGHYASMGDLGVGWAP